MGTGLERAIGDFIKACEAEGLTAEVGQEDWISNDLLTIRGLGKVLDQSDDGKVEILPPEGPIAATIKADPMFRFLGGEGGDSISLAVPGGLGSVFQAAGIDTKCLEEGFMSVKLDGAGPVLDARKLKR